MRKDILVFIITTSIMGALYGGALVTKSYASSWADSVLEEYVTILAYSEDKDSIRKEIRQGRIDPIQDRVDELEWTKTQRPLTEKEAWELQKRKTDLKRLMNY